MRYLESRAADHQEKATTRGRYPSAALNHQSQPDDALLLSRYRTKSLSLTNRKDRPSIGWMAWVPNHIQAG